MPRPRELGQPSWPAILNAYVERGARHINKAEPARVLAYDAETQTVDVQPVVQIEMQPGEYESPAPLFGVPVVWPGGAAGFLHVPLVAGDNVLIVHCDQDFSQWFNTGSVSRPQILDRHGLHPIAIPGLNPETSPFPVIAGTHVTLSAADELRLGGDDASDPVALAPAVTEAFDTLTTALDGLLTAVDALAPGTKAAWDLAMATFSSAVAASKVKAV